MIIREIDMNRYPRRAHYEHFRHLPNPHVGLTADVDVTELVRLCREKGWSFYLAMIRVTALAANAVPELRRRVRGEGIVEYDACPTSHIELLDDGTYCYCTLRHDPVQSWADYMAGAEAARAASRARATIEEEADADAMLFVSTVPWLHYTDVVQPTDGPDDSNPRICWGRFEEDFRGRLLLPLTLLCHHALLDGFQIAGFFREVDRLLAEVRP